MRRKIISIGLLLVLLATFVSCGSKGEEDTTTSAVFSPQTTYSGGVYADGTDAPETQPVAQSNLVTVTVPEGYTLVRLSWLLEDKGICSSDAFIEAAQNYDLSKFSILSSVRSAKNVCFPLEGYLFPATYEFEKNTDPNEVIQKMVSTFSSRFTEDMQARAKALGYSVHEILTIASIIEKEAFTAEQRTLIASTLYNRLDKGMKLQCDVTVKYCTGVIETQYPDKIDHYKYYYNTYRCDALPAGPICNPGMSSINAALYPDDTDYLYFVIDTEPPHEARFAATYEEHQKNCAEMGY